MSKPMEAQLNEIPIPHSLHTRCRMGIEQAKHEMEDHTMKRFPKKIAAAAVALVLCGAVLTGGIAATANSDSGFFVDLFRGTAVVGTEYQNATAEVDISLEQAVLVRDGTVHLTVSVAWEDAEKMPYLFLEEIAMGDFAIVDGNGKEVVAVTNSDGSGTAVVLCDGMAEFDLPVSDDLLSRGEQYTLRVKSIYGLSKADAPLKISGSWVCEFSVQ